MPAIVDIIFFATLVVFFRYSDWQRKLDEKSMSVSASGRSGTSNVLATSGDAQSADVQSGIAHFDEDESDERPQKAADGNVTAMEAKMVPSPTDDSQLEHVVL